LFFFYPSGGSPALVSRQPRRGFLAVGGKDWRVFASVMARPHAQSGSRDVLLVLVCVLHGDCMGIFGGTLIGRRHLGRIRRIGDCWAMEMFGRAVVVMKPALCASLDVGRLFRPDCSTWNSCWELPVEIAGVFHVEHLPVRGGVRPPTRTLLWGVSLSGRASESHFPFA
jgi:hypothetical protein